MLMNRNKIRRLIFESFVKHDRYLMRENFYLYDVAAANDPAHDKGWSLYEPLAEKIVDYLADNERLPRFENRMTKPRIVASGAEGIVVSLDDFKVVKLFHSLENAAKNLNLVSNSPNKTAKVYSKGVINLNAPVVYWKQGSMHNRRMKNKPISRLFYIVMERIIPDRFVFKNIDMELDKFVLVRHVKFDEVLALYGTQVQSIMNKIEDVYLDIIAAAYPQQRFVIKYGLDEFEKVIQFISDPSKHGKHKRQIAAECNNLFVVHGKTNPTESFVDLDNGRPLTLKMLCLNALGIVNNFPGADDFEELFRAHLLTQRIPGRKKLANNNNTTLFEDYRDILDLIEEIIITSNLQWRDIHEEQFGRRSGGELIALDIGGKEFNLDRDIAARKFETNVSSVNLSLPDMHYRAPTLSSVEIDSPQPSYQSLDYLYDIDIDDIPSEED